MPSVSRHAFLAYTFLSSAAFWANPQNMLTKTTFPQSSDNEVALLVGELYLQVIGTLFLMLFFMKLSPKFGQVFAMLSILLTMGKHMMVDQITPPPILMAATMVLGLLSIADLKVKDETQDKPTEAVEQSTRAEFQTPKSTSSKKQK